MMKPGFGWLLLAVLVPVLVYLVTGLLPGEHDADVTQTVSTIEQPAPGVATATDAGPERVVLDISVHTEEELQVLFDRAGQLADKLHTADRQASIVLVLHGIRGVERDDIPPFIEQVPLGSAEVNRLVREGYVYF
jgi:hypothetical protein